MNEKADTMFAWMGLDDNDSFGILIGLAEHPLFGTMHIALISSRREQAIGILRTKAEEALLLRKNKTATLYVFTNPQILEIINQEEKDN